MQDNQRMRHVDAWRFIAVAMVIVYHITYFSHPWYRQTMPGLVWRLREFGLFGVLIFFCISGFVICRGLMHEKAQSGWVSLKGFYARRFFRILPPLLAYMAGLGVLSALGWAAITPAQFGRSAMFVCNIKPLGGCSWFLGHTWSLAYEEQFYLVFPLLFVAMAAARTRLVLPVLTIALVAAAVMAHAREQALLAEFLSMFCYLLCGCVAALYWDRLRNLLTRMPPALWLFITASTLYLGCLAGLPAARHHLFMTVLAPPAICVMVLGTPVSVAAVRAFFLNDFVAYCGRISFTVYLWQQAATYDYGMRSTSFAFIATAAVWLLAHFSYRYFEAPLIRVGAWYSRRLKAARAPLLAPQAYG